MREFRVRVEYDIDIAEDEMRRLLAMSGWSDKKIGKAMTKLSDKDLEWKILSDCEVVRSVEIGLAVMGGHGRIQLTASTVEPDEELDPEAVAAVAQEKADEEAKEGSPT